MPLINTTIEQKIYQYVSEQLRNQGCPVRIINGMPDHIHCLFLLSPQKIYCRSYKGKADKRKLFTFR
ncbi:MAG: transposase [Flavobacteriaceae bacterium]|nr:transposase [Flavobacteriaceae bacterium]